MFLRSARGDTIPCRKLLEKLAQRDTIKYLFEYANFLNGAKPNVDFSHIFLLNFLIEDTCLQ